MWLRGPHTGRAVPHLWASASAEVNLCTTALSWKIQLKHHLPLRPLPKIMSAYSSVLPATAMLLGQHTHPCSVTHAPPSPGLCVLQGGRPCAPIAGRPHQHTGPIPGQLPGNAERTGCSPCRLSTLLQPGAEGRQKRQAASDTEDPDSHQQVFAQQRRGCPKDSSWV